MKTKTAAKHEPDIRCESCQWVHESDSVKQTSYIGVKLCPLHAAATGLLKALKGMMVAFARNATVTPKGELQSDVKRALDAIAKAEPPKKAAPDWFA